MHPHIHGVLVRELVVIEHHRNHQDTTTAVVELQ